MMSMIFDRRAVSTTMVRTRLMIGLLSIAHGAGALFFDYGAGISKQVHNITGGWVWSILLIVMGALMILAAIGERIGYSGRFCRDFSVSFLGATWLGLWVESFPYPDTLTLIAPIYILFSAWAWFAEASAERNRNKRTAREG